MNIYTFKKNLFSVLLIGIIFIALPTYATASLINTYFISGFINKEGVTVPKLRPGESITKITGKLSRGKLKPAVDFMAIKVGYNSFLAQFVEANHMGGVFFEITSENKIIVTEVYQRICDAKTCKNDDNLNLNDKPVNIAVSQNDKGYGIFDILLTATSAFGIENPSSAHYALPNFVSTQPTLIPNVVAPLHLNGRIMTVVITGKLSGSGIGKPVDFIAVQLDEKSFLAQVRVDNTYKKGVFFEIDEAGKIKVTQARYCELTSCLYRNLALSDFTANVATSTTDDGYGIFDLNLSITPTASYSFPGFVTTKFTPIVTPSTSDANDAWILGTPTIDAKSIVKITAKMDGSWVDGPYDLTVTRLGDHSFLAWGDLGLYKKGSFFEINAKGEIKVTHARYCVLANSSCKNRILRLTDFVAPVVTGKKQRGYGIYDITVFSPLFATKPPKSNAKGVCAPGWHIPADNNRKTSGEHLGVEESDRNKQWDSNQGHAPQNIGRSRFAAPIEREGDIEAPNVRCIKND